VISVEFGIRSDLDPLVRLEFRRFGGFESLLVFVESADPGVDDEHEETPPGHELSSDVGPQGPHDCVDLERAFAHILDVGVVDLAGVAVVLAHHPRVGLLNDDHELDHVNQNSGQVDLVRYRNAFGVDHLGVEDDRELALGQLDGQQVGELVLLLPETGGGQREQHEHYERDDGRLGDVLGRPQHLDDLEGLAGVGLDQGLAVHVVVEVVRLQVVNRGLLDFHQLPDVVVGLQLLLELQLAGLHRLVVVDVCILRVLGLEHGRVVDGEGLRPVDVEVVDFSHVFFVVLEEFLDPEEVEFYFEDHVVERLHTLVCGEVDQHVLYFEPADLVGADALVILAQGIFLAHAEQVQIVAGDQGVVHDLVVNAEVD